MGEVALLQYHHGVPDVPVPEVHPHRRPRQRLATTPFDWAGTRSCLLIKCHHVGSGLVAPGCLIALRYQPTFHYAVLGLAVRHQ